MYKKVFKFFTLLLFVSLYLFAISKNVLASNLNLTGKAKISNTGAYLDFSGYSSNVYIDSSTGNFNGYAFMEDVGWVDFGAVDNAFGPVNINVSTGVVTGKAKVLNTGGYLDFTNYSSNVVATIPGGVFSGNVFSEDVGWINFADTGVSTDSSFDNVSPSGGSISYTNDYVTTNSVALSVSDGTDLGSGINTSSRTVQRKSATLTNGTCGVFGSFSTISHTGTYPNFTDTTVTSGNCYMYQYLISDNASNQTTYTSASIVKLDSEGPVISGSPTTTNPTNSVSQTWSFSAATDTASGFASYIWRTTGTAITSGTSLTNSIVTALAEGVYNFFVKGVDNAGNQGSEVSSSLTVDTTAPVTTDDVSANWSNSAVTVTLSCNDGTGTGCNGTYYTIDGTTPTTGSTQGTSIEIVDPGTYTIKYFSVDLATNTEVVKTAQNTVKIESVAPIDGSITYNNGYVNSNLVTLTVSDGTDSNSGINTLSRVVERKSAILVNGVCDTFGAFGVVSMTGIYPNFTDTTVISGNCYMYQYKISDNASNLSTYSSINVVKVDTTPPSNPGAPTTLTPTKFTSQTWNFDASVDLESNVASYSWRTTGTAVASGSSLTNSINTTLSDGIYTFLVKAVDNAGNQSEEVSGVILVDSIAPTTTNDISSSWSNQNVTVNLSCSDGTGMGCVGTYYTTNGDTPTTSSTQGTSFEITDSGTYTIKYMSVDAIGNEETVKTAANQVKIERVSPSGGSISYTNDYVTTNSVALSVSDGTDLGSGINTSSRTVQRKSATLTNGTCGVFGSFSTISHTGTYPNFTDTTVTSGNCYMYQYLISDNASNQTTYTSASIVKLDSEGPNAPTNLITTTPTKSLSQTWTFDAAIDTVSGVAGYIWRTTGTTVTMGSTLINSIATSFAEGVYRLFVRGMDNAGNYGNESNFTLTVDTTAPTVSSVLVDRTASTYATISWNNNETANSQVEYGLDTNYGTIGVNESLTAGTSHFATLSLLTSCTTYHYRIISSDLLENTSISSDATFTTAGCTGDAPVISNSASKATVVDGGSLNLLDETSKGIELTVPALFAASDLTFQAHQLEKENVFAVTSLPSGLTNVNNYVYELKALSSNDVSVTTFTAPITVTITYGDNDIVGLVESSLKIWRWDGLIWNELTNCNVNTTLRTVTCTTEHFSTFGLFGEAIPAPLADNNSNTSQSSSSSNSTSSYCGDTAPSSAPNLFQIDIVGDTAKLFFTPIVNTDSFFVSFSTNPNAEEHGGLVTLLREGVQSYTVFKLKPGTKYYFKVRGQKGCMAGSWSNIMNATAKSKTDTRKTIYYKNSFTQSLFIRATQFFTKPKAAAINTIETQKNVVVPTQESSAVNMTLVPTESTSKKRFCVLWWCW